MKIVVCIKQVPDTAEVKLDPKTGTLIRDGVPSIINHDDKAGLEAALRIREQLNDGSTVTVVCMGPPRQTSLCVKLWLWALTRLTWFLPVSSAAPIPMLPLPSSLPL